MNNIHITPNSFSHGSRILKETASLVESGIVKHAYIAALHDEELKEHEDIDGSRTIRRFRLTSRKWPRNFLTLTIKYLEFCFRVLFYAHSNNIKLVNIHNLVLLPLGVLLKWTCGAKLVYDTHELETEIYGLSGFSQSVARFIERILIRQVDLTVVVGNGINKWYRDKYKINNVITALNCPEFQKTKKTYALHDALGLDSSKRIILYQGGLVMGRGIEGLLESVSKMEDKKYVLVFMGYGEFDVLIKEYTDSYENIYLKEAVQPSVVLQYTASAYVGISYIDNPSLNDQLCLPNKLFEYIMAGLPVFVNNAPEMRDLVSQNDIGLVLKSLTTESLSEALKDLELMDSDELKDRLENVAKMSSWNNQAKEMTKAYKEFIV